MRQKLREIRTTNNLTMQQVADSAGITRSAYGNIEHARVNPSVPTAMKIAEKLNSSVEELFADLKAS